MNTSIPSVFPKEHYNYRKYILLTLSRSDATPSRSSITEEVIVGRITGTINQCVGIIVAKESHHAGGNHFHVGILLSRVLVDWPS